MTHFTKEEEVKATFSFIIFLFLGVISTINILLGSYSWVGLLIISFAFAIPFIRIIMEQEK